MSAASTAAQPQPQARTAAGIQYYASPGYQWVADADIEGCFLRQHRPPGGPGLRAGADQGQEGRGADARVPERCPFTRSVELGVSRLAWAGQVRDILRAAAAAVEAARKDRKAQLGPGLLADLRARYDDAVAWGITTNRLREWHKGRHPGCNLARRLHDRPSRSGYSRGSSRCPGRITPRSRHSKARSGIRPSPGTGTPPPRSPTTAGCAPTWSAHVLCVRPSGARKRIRLPAQCNGR
jgi:hypothetical protein